MKKTKKIVALVLATVLLVSTTVAVTVAYMTSLTDVVTNTFTTGSVEIKLDEAQVDPYGVPSTKTEIKDNDGKVTDVEWTEVPLADAPRVMANQYKLLPGHQYTKDPTVYVKAGSEVCYVFAKVEITEKIGGVLDNFIVDTANWLPLADLYTTDAEKAAVADIYYYKETVDARETATEYLTLPAVFSSFTILSDADVTDVTAADSIKITAYAIQADGMSGVADAWTKAPTSWTK